MLGAMTTEAQRDSLAAARAIIEAEDARAAADDGLAISAGMSGRQAEINATVNKGRVSVGATIEAGANKVAGAIGLKIRF